MLDNFYDAMIVYCGLMPLYKALQLKHSFVNTDQSVFCKGIHHNHTEINNTSYKYSLINLFASIIIIAIIINVITFLFFYFSFFFLLVLHGRRIALQNHLPYKSVAILRLISEAYTHQHVTPLHFHYDNLMFCTKPGTGATSVKNIFTFIAYLNFIIIYICLYSTFRHS